MLFPLARSNVRCRIKNVHSSIDKNRFCLTYRLRLCIIQTLKQVEKASLQMCAGGLPGKIAQGSFDNIRGVEKMLLRKTGLWTFLMSLSLPVIQHAGMLQTAGGSALFVPACLGYWISESIKGTHFKFRGLKLTRRENQLRKETNELRAT